jgi:hypothetical protein
MSDLGPTLGEVGHAEVLIKCGFVRPSDLSDPFFDELALRGAAIHTLLEEQKDTTSKKGRTGMTGRTNSYGTGN